MASSSSRPSRPSPSSPNHPPSQEIDLRSERDQPTPPTPLPSDQVGIRSVRVFDPQRHDGINALFYAIESKRVAANGSIRHDCVRRRFSDFVWLRHQLHKSFPGCVVPLLPTKSVLGTMQPNFVEKRQRGLNLFMERIVTHPRLKLCSALDVLLSASDSDFEMIKQGRTNPEASFGAASAGLLSFFNQTFQSVQESLLGPGSQLKKSDDDVRFEAMADSVWKSLKLANNCLGAYQTLAAAHKEFVQWWADFGLSLSVLAAHESNQEHAESGAALNETGLSADRISVLLSHHLDKEYSAFKEPLRDLIDQLRSVGEALRARAQAVVAVQQASLDVKTKKSRLESLRRRSGSEKVDDAEGDLARAEQIAGEMTTMLERVTEEARCDFRQFQLEKQTVLKRLAQAFIQIQIAHSHKVLSSP